MVQDDKSCVFPACWNTGAIREVNWEQEMNDADAHPLHTEPRFPLSPACALLYIAMIATQAQLESLARS